MAEAISVKRVLVEDAEGSIHEFRGPGTLRVTTNHTGRGVHPVLAWDDIDVHIRTNERKA